jgi:hypothetical protein
MKKLASLPPLALTFAIALVPGCEEHAEVPDAEACEHFPEGPFEPVEAAADPDDAPTVDQVHVAYQIDLSPNAPVYVTFGADEANEFFFFTSEPVAMEFLVDGAAVTPEELCESGDCSELCDLIESRAVLDLEGGPVTVGLGPGDGMVMLLVEEGGAHDHED